MENFKKGQLAVWHVPQIPGKSFSVLVENLTQARLLLETLAHYDQFQLDHKIKPDYSSVQGVIEWDGEAWADWEDADSDDVEAYDTSVVKHWNVGDESWIYEFVLGGKDEQVGENDDSKTS